MAYRILLADDSITIQKVVELILSEEDVEIKPVNDGMEALESLSEVKPDIVLADIEMPRLDGYELCEKIKNNPATASIPVILLAGAFEPFDEGRARAVGADDFLIKPFDSSDLLGKIEAINPIVKDKTPDIKEEPAEESVLLGEDTSEVESKPDWETPQEEKAIHLEEDVTPQEEGPEEKAEEVLPLEEEEKEEEEKLASETAWNLAGEQLTEAEEPVMESGVSEEITQKVTEDFSEETIEEHLEKDVEKGIERDIEEDIEEDIGEPESIEADALGNNIAGDEWTVRTEEATSSEFISSEQATPEAEIILEAVEADPDMPVNAEAEVVRLAEGLGAEEEFVQMAEQNRETVPELSRDEVTSIVQESVSSILPDSASIEEAVRSAVFESVPEKSAIDEYIRESVPVVNREDVMSLVRESVASMLPDGQGIEDAVKSAINGALPEKSAIDEYIRESVPVVNREDVMSLVRESVASMLPDGQGIEDTVKSAINGALPEKSDIHDSLQEAVSSRLPSKDDLETLIASSLDSENIKAMVKDAVYEKLEKDLLPAFKSMIEDILLDLIPKTTEQVTREVLGEALPAGITNTIEKVSLESMPGLAENLIAKVIEKIRSGS